MNKPYLSPHTRTELENVAGWLEKECLLMLHHRYGDKDSAERFSFMEGYMQAIFDLQKLSRDAGKKDIDDISLALKEQQERLENELE